MKNKFDKQFKNEFEHNFEPNIDINLLKQNLNIQPKNTNNLVLKKKVFFSYSIILSLLLIVVTALTTFVITKLSLYSEMQPTNENEEIDVIKMFQDKYVNSTVKLVGQCKTSNNIELSILFVKSTKDNMKARKYIIYFNEVPTNMLGKTTYTFSINNKSFNGEILNEKKYIEYDVEYYNEYSIKLELYLSNDKIFDFCTKI